VIGVSRSKEPNSVFLPYKSSKFIKNFKFIKLDINKNAINLKKIIKKYKITHIVNFAAQSMVGQSWEKPEDWYNTNTLGTVKFLNLIRDIKTIKKYVHISTPEVYGSTKKRILENRSYQPSTPYAISRAACDMHLYSLFQNFKFPVVFTRAANVYGPGQQLYRIVPKAIMCLKLNKTLKLDGGGKSKRSFIYIRDVVKATYKLCNKSINGDVYHISTNKLVSIKI
jgi:dTDP-glucose 4,6-dehydratase